MKKNNMIGFDIKSNNVKWNNIMQDYKNIVYLSLTKEDVPYSIIYYDYNGIGKNAGYVYFKYETIFSPKEDDLTDLLHEIGHIVTNRDKMKRCVEEYLATQWAIDHAKKYNVRFSKKRINEFQNYIYKWRETGIKHKAKNIPSKEELLLKG